MRISFSSIHFGNTPPYNSQILDSARRKTEQEWLDEIHKPAGKSTAAQQMQAQAAAWFQNYHAMEKAQKAQQEPTNDSFRRQESGSGSLGLEAPDGDSSGVSKGKKKKPGLRSVLNVLKSFK